VVIGLLIFWAILGAIVGAVAQSKGRGFGGWFVYGFLLFPIALIHILVAERRLSVEDVAHAAAMRLATDAVANAGRRKCPHCAEMIQAEARVCRYCQRDITTAAPAR